MVDHVYKVLEIVGSSEQGIENAIENAIVKAGQTVRHMRWFEMTGVRGHIENGQVHHYQVSLRVGFTLEEEGAELQP